MKTIKIAVINVKSTTLKSSTKTNIFAKSWSGRYFHLEGFNIETLNNAKIGDNLSVEGTFLKGGKFACSKATPVTVKPKTKAEPSPQKEAVA